MNITDKLADALEEAMRYIEADSTASDDAYTKARKALEAYRAQRDGEREELEPAPVRECFSISGYHEWVTSWTGGTKQCRQCRLLDRRPLAKGEG